MFDDFAGTAASLGSIASLFNRSVVLRRISGTVSLNSAKRGRILEPLNGALIQRESRTISGEIDGLKDLEKTMLEIYGAEPDVVAKLKDILK